MNKLGKHLLYLPSFKKSTTNCGTFLKRWEYQTILPASWETCKKVKKQELEWDMEPLTGSKLGKEYIKAVYYHLAYLEYVKCQAGWIISWNLDCWEKYQQPQIYKWYHSNGRKSRGTKEPLDEGERGEWKSWPKTQHSAIRVVSSAYLRLLLFHSAILILACACFIQLSISYDVLLCI